MKTVLQLEGLDCAACAGELEEEIAAIEGVKACSVTFMTQKLEVEYDGEETLSKVKDVANHFEEVRVVEEEGKENKKGTVIKIQNLDCAACAAELQEQLEKIPDIRSVSVDFIGQSIYVEGDETVLKKVIKTANHFEEVKVVNEDSVIPKKESHKKEWLQLGISFMLFVAALLCEKLWAKTGTDVGAIFSYVLYGLAYLAVGYPVLISTAKNISKGKIFDENFLMTAASIGAFALLQLSEAVEVMWLYQLGELLQSIAVGASRRSITSLMDLRSESANLLKDGKQIVVKPEELKIGDLILVKAGEKIPVDGVIVEGATSLDTKSLTGESALRDVAVGSEVLSGCINAGGNITVKTSREYTDSAVAKILDLVENSASKKAKPEKFITKFAKYYTPIVCAVAVLIAVFVPLISGWVTGNYTWTEWITKALNLLVISCPCALIISIPLTYFGGIGCAAKHGILVKGATYLDEVAKATIAAFDKTGTLTEGNFNIVNVVGKEQTLPVAAALEKGSSHPLARPFDEVNTPFTATEIKEIAGRGVQASIDGKQALAGNAKLLQENNVSFERAESLSTVIYVAWGGEYLGYIEIDDRVKADAKEALAALKAAGVQTCAMVTGDNPARAEQISAEIGELDKVYAGLLPDEKLQTIEDLKGQGKVLYVGDGINDAPVMTVADCSFSMGKIGSGAAIEASDIVVVSDNLSALPLAVRIAKKTRVIVTENLIFSLAAKFALMVLSLTCGLPLSIAVLGDVGVMLLAVVNSLRMRMKMK
jgi:Cd2+/Zn2+-exporting ATPase